VINVFLVDDSAVVRQVLTEILTKAPGITVMGSANDPIFAQKRLAKLEKDGQWPDVIVLDIEMPHMDGLTYLKKIMAEHPTPVLMCSTLTSEGSSQSLQALRSGAVDVIAKPKTNLKVSLGEASKVLVEAVRTAAKANTSQLKNRSHIKPAAPALQPQVKLSADAMLAKPKKSIGGFRGKLIAIGTSTGGTQALEEVLMALPADIPPILVVQHMPAAFTGPFAERLNSVSKPRVIEAKNHQPVMPGTVYIAPGHSHLMLLKAPIGLMIEVKDGPLVSRHKPSVDVLFRSFAKYAGNDSLGIIMTGMGEDGALGLKEMRDGGCKTIGQNKETCVVYGMPDSAFKKGGVMLEVPLDHIANQIIAYSNSK